MSTSLQSVADVCNYALAKIGFRLRVGSLYDGTPHAKKLLDVYGETRDAVLRGGDWDFALKSVTGGTPVGSPPYPWTTQYAYPTDCIRVRNVYDSSSIVDPYNPLPTLWTIADDATYGKVIQVRNANTPTLVYTAQITNPALWEPLFLDAVASALGRNLRAIADKDDPNFIKLTDEEIAGAVKNASEVVG